MGGPSEVHEPAGGPPPAEPTAFVPPTGPTHDPETYRGRLSAAAHARGIPLATILTTVLVAFLVLDVNFLVILLLWVLRTIVLYAVVAFFIALLLSPAVHLVQRVVPSRGWAVTIVFLVTVIAVIGIVVLFTAPLVEAVTHFAKQLPTLVQQAEHGRGRIGHLLKRFHLQQWVTKNAPKLAGDITRSLKPAQALSVGAAAFSSLVALGTIAVLSLFVLLEAPMLRRAFLGLLSPARAERFVRVYDEASRAVTGYMLGNGLTSLMAGVIVFVTLVVMGVPYPFLLGLWVALVDLLPLVGGLLAGVPVVIIAAFHSVPALIVTLVVFLVYQQIENHVLNPVVMSKTVRLNPLWVLLAVLVGATLGDRIGAGLGSFVGALIGIPVGGAVQVVAREIRRGPSGEVAGRPPDDLGDVPTVP
ncbi:MAG TPA: AI-2E family transporter [Acidimicrobiales bacterium]|jgi:predicted PurR-regulated permease PerM|nr:AI-2E family transporter [Acidimicrobiales bacterium]